MHSPMAVNFNFPDVIYKNTIKVFLDNHLVRMPTHFDIKLLCMTSNLVKPRGNPANLKRAGIARCHQTT